MKTITKSITIAAMAITLATMLTVSAISPMHVDAVKPSDKVSKEKSTKAKTCSNIKVQIKVSGVEENQTIAASVTIGNSSKTKSGIVEANETSITIPINFNKVFACPPIGSEIFGNVNGTGFTSELTSLKKPNKISVDLS